ncbi:MAG: PaaI family thioesterase [Alphaproteobacteria bacterium]|nr:PaaI family thioesterase [Alphaproteobacteria bacterium]MDP6564292.1 PaaI family thioesterase [Alphaproteobacteria bacterium]MDP6811841.1 PaaI family thioesterase [Alphaproteobacteria bacterium]
MSDEGRSRSYAWEDPSAHWSRLGDLTGLEYLSVILNGEVPPPPVAVAMRLRLTEVSEGRVVYAGLPGEDFGNDVGSIQGGWLAALIDAAIGSAVHSTLPKGARYTTLELKVNFVRAVMPGSGEMTCTAETVHAGRRTATARARVEDAAGKLYAHATTTCLVIPAE